MKHTPTPYESDGFGWIARANGEKVSGAEVLDKLNAHDELVAALREIDAKVYDASKVEHPRGYFEDIRNWARAALAKVMP